MKLAHLAVAVPLLVVGCGPPRSAASRPSERQAVSSSDAGAASAAPDGVLERPELRRHFEAERVTGVIAIFDSAAGSVVCSDSERCRKEYIPVSTFKIPSSMIGLETGVVEDSETVLPWDGKHRDLEAWNRDHTLRSAIQVSCVPCYQAIARKVGPEGMAEWLVKLDYGNRDSSGGVDLFWLTGGLRITPLQQLDFLRRFDGNELPISERTADIVRDIITLDVGQNHVLRGKTGLGLRPEQPMDAGWFVGWVELGERRIFFASVIDGFAEDVEVAPLRRRLTEAILKDMSVLP